MEALEKITSAIGKKLEGRKPSRLMMNILIFMVVLLIAVCMVIPNV